MYLRRPATWRQHDPTAAAAAASAACVGGLPTLSCHLDCLGGAGPALDYRLPHVGKPQLTRQMEYLGRTRAHTRAGWAPERGHFFWPGDEQTGG